MSTLSDVGREALSAAKAHDYDVEHRRRSRAWDNAAEQLARELAKWLGSRP
jgi:hypothetical protein